MLYSNKMCIYCMFQPLCPSQFRAGMKLEAVDRKNSSLICVASVANLIDNRLLIHFDSWGDVYDYWADPTSPYIHPVGWCEENGYDLTPPNSESQCLLLGRPYQSLHPPTQKSFMIKRSYYKLTKHILNFIQCFTLITSGEFRF